MLNTDNLNVQYFGDFISKEYADDLLVNLKLLNYDKLTFTFKGKSFSPKRGVYNIGEKYDFGGNSPPIHPWTPFLDELRHKVEQHTGRQYNEALVNLYVDGSSGISAHRDNETSLCRETGIACVSFGATRKIIFKRKGFEPRTLEPTHGSLYTMMAPTNQYWSHESPKDLSVKTSRISVTFRKIAETTPTQQKKSKMDDSSDASSPQKKVKLDELPDGDWFEKQHQTETLWNLSDEFVIFIESKGTMHRIVIKNTKANTQVRMIPKTWSVFSTIISDFNTQQQSVGIQVNNQLICFGFSGYMKLHQCFYKSSEKRFTLSTNYIDLPHEGIAVLKTVIPELNMNISHIVAPKT